MNARPVSVVEKNQNSGTTLSSAPAKPSQPQRMPLSERNQYEITDVQNEYLKLGQLHHDVLDCDWSDAGTPETLWRAADLIRKTGFVPPVDVG